MKLTAHVVDVRKGKLTTMRAVGEQDVCALSQCVDPAAGAGEACVAESIQRQARTRGGVFGCCQLPGEGTSFVQALRHVHAKELAGVPGKKIREPADELIRQA